MWGFCHTVTEIPHSRQMLTLLLLQVIWRRPAANLKRVQVPRSFRLNLSIRVSMLSSFTSFGFNLSFKPGISYPESPSVSWLDSFHLFVDNKEKLQVHRPQSSRLYLLPLSLDPSSRFVTSTSTYLKPFRTNDPFSDWCGDCPLLSKPHYR